MTNITWQYEIQVALNSDINALEQKKKLFEEDILSFQSSIHTMGSEKASYHFVVIEPVFLNSYNLFLLIFCR